ncbi:MAG: alpha/beta hydrolase [Steroidobacteraceae bacterium]
MKRRTRLALAVAVMAVVLGVQWVMHHPKWRQGEAPKGAAPPAHYRLGAIDFTPCELKAPLSGQTTAGWCAPFVRPENPADAAGRQIHMRLALIRSSAARPASDLVVFITGGPGESAINDWPEVAPALKSVLEHRDVVLLDQRGTGGSHPLSCPTAAHAAELARKQRATSHAPRQTPAQRQARQAAEIQACLAEIEQTADPRFFTTTDAVDDLIALRHALGDPQFDLVGVSYGTRVAQQYAMRDPTGVRSIVLDGVLPNSAIVGEDIARNLQDALKADLDLCEAEPACLKAFGDPYADLTELRARIDQHPPVVTYRDPDTDEWRTRTLDENTLAVVVRLFSYSPLTAALLPLGLHQALAGDYGPLMAQSRLVGGALGRQVNGGMQWAVLCTEDAPLLKPDPDAKGTLLGAGFVADLQRQCAAWPRGQMPADFHQPLHTDVPTLILEGQYDPITPPRYGREVLAHLGDARLLIARGQGHYVMDAGCMPQLVDKFVADLKPKALDARCLNELRPTPPFVSFNGATP